MNEVYFIADNSYYRLLPDLDLFDLRRNALSTVSSAPAIYHPPCRSWGRLRQFAKTPPGEHWLAVWAVLRMWRYGGVLEHPAGSKLWSFMNLAHPGQRYDSHGGFSVSLNQSWFGYPAKKNTWLYVVGCEISDLPAMPLCFNAISKTVSSSKNRDVLKELSHSERSRTTLQFNEYLVTVLNTIKSKRNESNL